MHTDACMHAHMRTHTYTQMHAHTDACTHRDRDRQIDTNTDRQTQHVGVICNSIQGHIITIAL